MPQNIKKIIELIKKTGDNCIVLDHEGNPAYVILSFTDYQDMVLGKSEVAGLAEDELLNKINRDIAAWKASQEAESLDNWPASPSASPRGERGEQAVESVVEEMKKPLFSHFEEEKLLNQANNEEKEENSEEKYYFEPID